MASGHFSAIIWSFDLGLGSYTTIGLNFHKNTFLGIYLAFWVTFSNFSIISGHFGGLADLPKMADFSVFSLFLGHYMEF